MNLFFAHMKSYQKKLTMRWLSLLLFTLLYFREVILPVSIVYWIKTPAKGTTEEDLRKIVAQNRQPEKSKDDSLCELKCLCCH